MERPRKKDIRDGLLLDLPRLLRTLFPDTPMALTSRGEWKIGKKGALSVVSDGARCGLWRDFDGQNHSHGIADVIGLISFAHAGSLSDGHREKSWDWAANWLGMTSGAAPSPAPRKPSLAPKNNQPFSVTKIHCPIPDHVMGNPVSGWKPRFPAKHQPTDWWIWRDRDGHGIFITYRIEIPETTTEPAHKIILPLSWCTISDTRRQSKPFDAWWCHGVYSVYPHLPLFDLPAIISHPERPILIVEGEKTACAAKKIYPNLVVTTWHGGVGNVQRTDWSVLSGRTCVIFPDADPVNKSTRQRPGLQAALSVREVLCSIGAKSGIAGAAGLEIQDGIGFVSAESGLFDVAPANWDHADPFTETFTPFHAARLIEQVLGDMIRATGASC